MGTTEPNPRSRSTAVSFGALAIGGALGASLRYAFGVVWAHQPGEPPVGTFVANLLGCLGMGLFLGWVSRHDRVPQWLTLLVATGFLGGLTTFSSFAADGVVLAESRQVLMMGGYVAATVLFGWVLLRIGWLMSRRGDPLGFVRERVESAEEQG